MEAEVLVLVGTVVGALLGGSATLFAQRGASSTEKEKQEQVNRESRRTELRQAIDRFNRAKQVAQHVADNGNDAQRLDAQIELWVRFDQLILLSGPELENAAHELSLELVACLHGSDRTLSADKVVKGQNLKFVEVSRKAMEATLDTQPQSI